MTAGHLTPILSQLHLRHLRRCRPFFCCRPLSSANDYTDKAPPPSSSAASASQSEAEARREAYQQLQNLDFMTASKILFTTPPKRKKFGLDFHLELEVKKKEDEEEQKAKEAELNKDEEESKAELSEVKARLNALEETVKEIANETTKISSSISSKDQLVDKKDQVVTVDEKSNNLSQQPKADEQATISKKEKVDVSGP